jgi:hypothetical protein
MIQPFLMVDRLSAISLAGSIVDGQLQPIRQDRNADAQHPILKSARTRCVSAPSGSTNFPIEIAVAAL